MTLVTQGLIAPARLLALSPEELTQLLRRASHGRHGVEAAMQLRHSALTTLAMPPAEAAVSYSLALLGRSYLYVVDQILRPLEHRIRELLQQVPFRHHLEEIPFFGPIVIGTVLGELGQPAWFRTADDIVAWFGLDPAVFASAGKQAAGLPLTKRGSRYGRRILWLAAQNWCKYTTIGRAFFRHYRFGKGLSYDATVCAFAARLAKLSWAMLRDGTHYDARRAFRAYLPAQIPA
jgi:transposase